MAERSASLAGLMQRGCDYIRLHCTVLGCGRSGSADPLALSLRFGEAATLVQIERAAVCKHCGAKGKCWSEPIINYTPRMGLGANAWESGPREKGR